MPSWVKPNQCSCTQRPCDCDCPAFRRPATWLSVLGRDGYWAIAAINEETINRGPRDHRPITQEDSAETSAQNPDKVSAKHRDKLPADDPSNHLAEVPITLKLWLLLVTLFIAFHLWCCSHASFTAKPSFLTHFANPGTRRHTLLIFLGGFFAAMLPILAGWACGVFDLASVTLAGIPGEILGFVADESLAALSAGVFNVLRVAQLPTRDNGSRKKPPEPHLDSPTLAAAGVTGSVLALAVLLFAYAFPLQRELSPRESPLHLLPQHAHPQRSSPHQFRCSSSPSECTCGSGTRCTVSRYSVLIAAACHPRPIYGNFRIPAAGGALASRLRPKAKAPSKPS